LILKIKNKKNYFNIFLNKKYFLKIFSTAYQIFTTCQIFTKSLKVRYPAELPPTLLAQACVYSDSRQIFHVFSFSFSFIPHQIFRRWTFVASEAQMQSAVASKRPCKYINTKKSLRSRCLFFFCGFRFKLCGCSYDGHWRLTWSLTSGSVGLVEVRASWPGHPR